MRLQKEIGISYAIAEGDQREHEAPMDVEVKLVALSRSLVVAPSCQKLPFYRPRHQRLRGLMRSCFALAANGSAELAVAFLIHAIGGLFKHLRFRSFHRRTASDKVAITW